MKDILEVIIKNLVTDKDSVEITENVSEKSINLKVKVAQSDMGIIIGKQGKTAMSIRTIMKAVSSKENKRVNVEFLN